MDIYISVVYLLSIILLIWNTSFIALFLEDNGDCVALNNQRYKACKNILAQFCNALK